MRRFILPVLVVLATSASSFADAPKWEIVRSDDGIVVSRKEIPGSDLLAFRGEGDVNASTLAVGSVLVDTSVGKEWIDSVVEIREIRKINDTEHVSWTHISTPFGMSDRDSVTKTKLTVDPVTKTVKVKINSVDDANAPKTSYIRINLDDSSFTLTPIDGGKRTHVVAEIHADPKGSVSTWLVNKFQKNWGYNTIKNLRAQVTKGGKIDPVLKAMIEAPPP